jgi:hypothetical protein
VGNGVGEGQEEISGRWSMVTGGGASREVTGDKSEGGDPTRG